MNNENVKGHETTDIFSGVHINTDITLSIREVLAKQAHNTTLQI
jgi:hypothetical protein